MKFYAHSVPERDQRDWQGLLEHLLAVAKLSASFAAPFGLSNAAFMAGLLHDLGKYDPRFQARLSGSTESVDHSTAGAAHILASATPQEQHFAELVAYIVAGHHAGLPDRKGERAALDERVAEFSDKVLDAAWRTEVLPHLANLARDKPFHFDRSNAERAAFQLAFLGRMLFSCLVDADFKDTEAFYASVKAIYAGPSLAVTQGHSARFDHRLRRLHGDQAVRKQRPQPVALGYSRPCAGPGQP